jgi:uncharacterized protein (DUF58 family)
MCAFPSHWFNWLGRGLGEETPTGRPLGAQRAQSGDEVLPAEILRHVRRLEIRTKQRVTELFSGQYHSVFKGQGMEFDEVREYVPGDDVRDIDWNVTARLGTPFVKKYAEERELTVFLLVDKSSSLLFGSQDQGKDDMAAEIGGLLAFSAITNQDKVGLLLFSDHPELLIPPRKGRPHGLRIIREIRYFNPAGSGTDLAEACETAIHAIRRRSVVFLLSDFLVSRKALKALDHPLGMLARKHDVIALNVTDPLEGKLPNLGLIEGEDLETGRSVLIDAGNEGSRRRINQQFESHREAVAQLFSRHGVDQVSFSAGEDPVEPMLRFFKLRERRLARG